MVFTRRLREGIRRGRIKCSVRIWTRPHVKAGGRYRMDEGSIVVDSIEPIRLSEITRDLARESGFDSVKDLLGIAKHGRGDNVYLIRFHYLVPGGWDPVTERPDVVGYSGTPLAKKLGIKPPLTLVAIAPPREYRSWLGALPAGVRISSSTMKTPEAVHLFATRRAVLAKHLASLRKRLTQSGYVWVSWPKKASKVETDITEDAIREVALPLGFVDIKVCAVSDVWSGLKLVIRKSERTG